MLHKLSLMIAAVLLLLCAASAPAQSSQPETAQPAAATSPQPDEKTADVSITANVTARELKFEVVPNPDVKFTGQPERNTVWEAERTNLPEQVQPGVTYRNIGIRLKIVSVFADIDRIVAEALGEVPITDNTPPPVEKAPQPAPPATQPTAKAAPPPKAPSTRASARKRRP